MCSRLSSPFDFSTILLAMSSRCPEDTFCPRINPNVLLHAPRQMPGTLLNLSGDVVDQGIGIGIDVVILHLERCTAFVGRYRIGTNRASRAAPLQSKARAGIDVVASIEWTNQITQARSA